MQQAKEKKNCGHFFGVYSKTLHSSPIFYNHAAHGEGSWNSRGYTLSLKREAFVRLRAYFNLGSH